MDLQLTGKRALVTGSSVGIGAAIAKALAGEGAFVCIHGRDESRAQQIAHKIEAAGGRAAVVLGDLTHDEDAERVADEAVAALGQIDILVNNAGGSGEKKGWTQTAPVDWMELYNRNVVATVRLVRLLVPAMRAAGWGRVVNISSGAGVLPAASGGDYSAAKAAVNNLTVSLSKEVGGDGVTVNAVSPGTIRTPHLEDVFRGLARDRGWADGGKGEWAEVEKAVVDNLFDISVGKVGTVEDIAHIVVFLCSPLSGYITGTNFRVDGGLVPTVQ